ncbi:hypothetical protein JTE90_002941 [Oedothorax gibbosus]|uniref:Homeobox domain-containing protein n=1 Tax=Oedothorax gibbosus TaxID=931172 RepID=A0AAV6UJ57_9ARAC|nr:hypothetical protein JTE90_002941 [Oedothorax gibbosus]
MMPLAPLPIIPVPSKPKMGFSIEALVGGTNNNKDSNPPTPNQQRPGSSPDSDHRNTNSGPVAPVATFPASAPGGVPFLDSICAGARGVLYPQHQHQHHIHDGGYGGAGMQAPFFLAGRETYPLYPWLLARHPRFLHRLPGPDGFLLHPFRKPKRIRTAFSPSQLLKLEHAFEKNHYVVGAERKQLAQSLSLTETQVCPSLSC